jgi:hypothetical protein
LQLRSIDRPLLQRIDLPARRLASSTGRAELLATARSRVPVLDPVRASLDHLNNI